MSAHSAYRSVALFDMFLRMMSDGYPVDQAEPLVLNICRWEQPLLGIVNMATSARGSVRHEDMAIRRKTWERRKEILGIIKNDLAMLLPLCWHADHLRLTVVHAFKALVGCGNVA